MTPRNHKIIAYKKRVNRFRFWVAVFFIGLMLPLVLMIYYGYQQFIYESYFQYRWKGSNALVQINKEITARLNVEQKRSGREYNFYQYKKSPLNNDIIKSYSPLTKPQKNDEETGLIGYFQITNDGILETPLLPHHTRNQVADEQLEMDWEEIERRFLIKDRIKNILSENKFDLKDEHTDTIENTATAAANTRIRTYPFQYLMTENDEIIFYRNAFNGTLITQGFIVDTNKYLLDLIASYVDLGRFSNTVQARMTSHKGKTQQNRYFLYQINEQGVSTVTTHKTPQTEHEELRIYFGNLISPFQDFELRFTTKELPMGPGSGFVLLFLIILLIAIIVGCLGFYWLGRKQIGLAEQRLNFVSSVSHELKTPLTSILMYSEMLKSNMVKGAADKKSYYDFIYTESERLSRLINNILKVSNISQQHEVVKPEYTTIETIQDIFRSKVSTLIANNQFTLNMIFDPSISKSTLVNIDLDAFSQIAINVIDNSVKFFNAAKIEDSERRKIDVLFNYAHRKNSYLKITVRDFGPGITASQSNKILNLFYRGGQEITRTSPGTGIGLALVNELMLAHQGHIEIERKKPGLAIHLLFPVAA